MTSLPNPEVYEQGLQYWPYLKSWNLVLGYLAENVPAQGSLLDLMCGPGHLLGKIAERRPDLELKGVDVDNTYILHARKTYQGIYFESGNVLKWAHGKQYDAVTCTGALHHIPYEQQEEAVRRIAAMVKPEGFVLISDCFIDSYTTEIERKIAAVKLGCEYLKETIRNGAPESVLEATVEILWNDVMMVEFKTSMKRRQALYERIFQDVETLKTWPVFESEYGDYISICRVALKKCTSPM